MGERFEYQSAHHPWKMGVLLLFHLAFAAATPDDLAERDANRLSCIKELQDEYRRVVGPHVEGKHAFLVDMVYHWNLGDSYIEYGEQLLMEEMGTPNRIFCSLHSCNTRMIKMEIDKDPKHSMILVQGGGNFGDVWTQHRASHIAIVKRYMNLPIVFLPQSIFYRSVLHAQSDAAVFAQHPKVLILARDNRSLAFLRETFPKTPSAMCPDGAFMIGPVGKEDCRHAVGVLVLARKDQERGRKYGKLPGALEYLDAYNITYRTVDWPCGINKKVLPENPVDNAKFKFEVGRKCLCQGKVLVTDRLHATILATLMGIPYVYLDNIYGKIHSYRESFFKSRPSCSDTNLRSRKAERWLEAMKIAKGMLHSNYPE